MKNLILILTMFAFFACNDSADEVLNIEDEKGLTQIEYQQKLEAYYATGYNIGTADADMIVSQTWTKEKCYTLKFKSETVTVGVIYGTGSTIGHTEFITNNISVDWTDKPTTCQMTSTAQLLGFQQFVGIGPYSGYTQALQNKVASTILYEKAFYEGVLAGFTDRLCGLSMTMPFNFTNCNAYNVPNTPTDRVHGGPSGGGPSLCVTCES